MRLTAAWLRKVELDELDIGAAWDLLVERVQAIIHKPCPTCGMMPCPDEKFCASMREADKKVRRCAKCGHHAEPLDPHRSGNKIIYLHRECLRFWRGDR
jgi:hypothetical protein